MNFQKLVIRCGKFFFRFRNALFPVIFVTLFLFTRPAYFLNNVSLDRFVAGLGTLLAFAGIFFRLLVIGFAYIKRGGKEGNIYADKLVVRGFYAHVRNPMYVGNFLIAVGLSLIYGAPVVYYGVIPFFTFAYYSIVVAEEKYLQEQFGKEYDDYMKRVNRFILNVHGLKKSLSEFHYDWKKALRKDYGTFFATLFAIVAIPVWKDLLFYGWHEKRHEIIPSLITIVVGAFVYLFVRRLKKTHKLVS